VGDDPEVRRAALKAHADVVPNERHHEIIASLLEGARTSNPNTLRSAVGGWGGRSEIWAAIGDFQRSLAGVDEREQV
jgi:CTP:molybdopterin cytidylyltransferase MocA